jgi:exosortase/archaeosortase family protein
MSGNRSFLIASACAGVNFLIAAFLMLSLRSIWNMRTSGVKWRFLFFDGVAAFAVTVIANAVRISSALWQNESHQSFAGFDRDEIHRLDGILIYFGFLLVLFVTLETLISKTKAGKMTFFFPLAIYYLTTLAVPILNGALRQGSDFWHHAAFVIATPILLIAAVAIPAKLFSRYAKRKYVAAVGTLFPYDPSTDEIGTRADVRNAAAFSHRTIGLKCGPVIGDR